MSITAENKSVNLILIATGQNWPNVFSAIYYKGVGLNRVVILSSDAMSKAKKDVGLQNTLKTALLIENVEVVSLGGNPYGAINAYLSALVKRRPNGEEWVLNIAGGLKAFAVEAAFYADVDWLTIIYREIGDRSWVRITKDTDGRPVYTQLAGILEAENKQEILTAEQLIRVHLSGDWRIDERTPGVRGDPCAPCGAARFPEPSKPDLGLMFDALSSEDDRGEQLRAFNTYFGSEMKNGGDPLEFFVLQAARFCGLRCHWGCQIMRNRNTYSEHDIVTRIEDRVVLFDVKWESDLGSVQQIEEAARKMNQVGGLNALTIMIRPIMPFRDDEIVYAKSLNIEVWGPDEMRGLNRVDAPPLPGFFRRMLRLSGTTDGAVATAMTALDDTVLTHPNPFGLVDRRVIDMRVRNNLAAVYVDEDPPWIALLEHDRREYLAVFEDRFPIRRIRPPAGYSRHSTGRALIFPWGIEVRVSHPAEWCRIHPEFEVKRDGDRVWCEISIETATTLAKRARQDLVGWLENILPRPD